MLKLFRKQKDTSAIVADKRQTVNELIDEIHTTFYSEVDRLLAESKIAKSLHTDKQDLIDKCNRLKALGFTSTQEVKDAQKEIQRLSALESENKTKQALISAINYFSSKYPQYKFITEESVKTICSKYNLVYGSVDKYIGTVPDKNIQQMQQFKVDPNDECYQRIFRSRYNNPRWLWGEPEDFHWATLKDKESYNSPSPLHMMSNESWQVFNICKLEICAPEKDFDMTNMETKDFKLSKIEIPDPVVLKPVIYNGQRYYLIVTAWGKEAGDEIIVNANHN